MRSLSEFLTARPRPDPANFVPFAFRGQIAGFIDRTHLERLAVQPEQFVVHADRVELRDLDLDYSARSQKLDAAVRSIYDEDSAGFGAWCPETTPVVSEFGEEPMFSLQRAAVGFFGILTCGVHLNVFSTRGGIPYLHIARRAAHIDSQPGLLDQAAAGFLPVGAPPLTKLVEEAEEEAGLAEQITKHARATGSVHFAVPRNPGLQRGAVYVYDLEIGPDQKLENRDGEIDVFIEMHPDDVAASIIDERFKFDSALVAADFLLRHGHIDPDNSDYLQIRRHLNAEAFCGGALE